MKGKIAFVLGAAVGYVLGTRAGHERYEQIKRGAQAVWNTDAVQRGVTVVRDAVDERADEVMGFVRRASANAFNGMVNRADKKAEQRAGQKAAAKTAPASEPATEAKPKAESKTKVQAKPKAQTKPKAGEGEAAQPGEAGS